MTSFSVKPTLRGDLVTLAPLTEQHFSQWWEAFHSDPDLPRLTGSQAELSEETARRWLATRGQTTDRLDLGVLDNGTDECIGEAVLHEWDTANRSCEYRTFLAAAGCGRGLGTEATRLIVGHAFEVLGMHRVFLGVYSFNHRALRCYEKAGFVREGVRRDALQWDGEWFDQITMSVLEDEWARHRGRPERNAAVNH